MDVEDAQFRRLGKRELGAHAFEDHMPARVAALIADEDDANTVADVIAKLARLLEYNDANIERAYLCSETAVQVYKLPDEGNHFCGYRNLQMLCLSLDPRGKKHTIPCLQNMIEDAWDMGFNSSGRVQTGGIKGTRKHIGTPEAEALLTSLDVPCTGNAFRGKDAWRELLDFVEAYFAASSPPTSSPKKKVYVTSRAPIFLQRPKHSLTIVGIERLRGGEHHGSPDPAMFRKPRTNDAEAAVIGRPPSPSPPAKTPFSLAVPPSVPAPKMAVKTSKPAQLPTIGRQGPSGGAKKNAAVARGKAGKPNGSILSFFKKSEDEGMFVEDRHGNQASAGTGVPFFRPDEVDAPEDPEEQEARFNESGCSLKRRKTSDGAKEPDTDGLVEVEAEAEDSNADREVVTTAVPGVQRKSGPFFEDSDSEHEDGQPEAIINIKAEPQDTTDQEAHMQAVPSALPAEQTLRQGTGDTDRGAAEGSPSVTVERPPLLKEETSFGMADFRDFEGMDDDFDEDLFEEGDEFMERRYMEEQARLEAAEEKDYDLLANKQPPNDGEASCPVCGLSLSGAAETDAAVHVNNCLDGNPSPLPAQRAIQTPSKPPTFSIKSESIDCEDSAKKQPPSGAQFRRPVRPPKPGQANPFTLGQPSGHSSGSAFNKLMSGHSEEAAWAEAAASEHSSRGKPAYQRTCPFYKILPGLFICVDAFRYGAVEGCQAYFLSHFHSDHYVGLTSSWHHGPIYCSKVTANLVKQQLRVDPKYVIALDWEKKTEVPGTKGVTVTMISANHCPGSSLYLFEKVVSKRSDSSPKLQRILHCGDFRACRMHVEHPLLQPEVRDAISGKAKEQKIDVCYLDTTYLNPKYAFPSQTAVITACADMCISLSKCTPDESDGWEQMKRQRAGEGMVKFVQRENSIKEEPKEDEETKDDMKVEKNPHPDASQQILSSSNAKSARGRLLVVVGTYSIGKERICLGIAKALNSLIYAPPSKQRIVAALEDPELDERMTNDPRAAQVHMTPLFEIRADTLDDYLKDYFPHFTRAVGFRPSGWNYRPPKGRFTDSPSVQTVLYSDNWKSAYSMRDLVPQRGSSSRASCFGVPYSEHSSFRELTMFCTALKIDKIIPTVNVGSAKGRERMKGWCERWALERRKNGPYKLPEDGSW